MLAGKAGSRSNCPTFGSQNVYVQQQKWSKRLYEHVFSKPHICRCAIDEYLFDELSYSNHSLSITAVSRAFKFVDQNELRFSCHVVLIKRRHKHEHLRVILKKVYFCHFLLLVPKMFDFQK
jgi:hypothetical protein